MEFVTASTSPEEILDLYLWTLKRYAYFKRIGVERTLVRLFGECVQLACVYYLFHPIPKTIVLLCLFVLLVMLTENIERPELPAFFVRRPAGDSDSDSE